MDDKDAAIARGMVARGDKRHDVAAWFGINQARIAEAEKGDYGSQVAATNLPPSGAPGPKGWRMRTAAGRALDAMNAGDIEAAKTALQNGIATYDRNEA